MCNECMTRGLWLHEESEQIDKFISGFTKKKTKKSAVYGGGRQPPQQQPPAPHQGVQQPGDLPSELAPGDLPPGLDTINPA